MLMTDLIKEINSLY